MVRTIDSSWRLGSVHITASPAWPVCTPAVLAARERLGIYLAGAGGSYEDALAATPEAEAIQRQQGRMKEVAEWLGSRAEVHFQARKLEPALRTQRETIRAFLDIGHLGRLGADVLTLAAIELALGRPERSIRLAAASTRLAEERGGQLGEQLNPVGDPLAEAQKRLTVEAVARGIEEGRSMTLDELVAYALVEPTGSGSWRVRDRYDLTPREREVLSLLVQGRSNAEIAEELFISPKTASVHLANIKGKLGASNRVEIVTNAIRVGLAEPPDSLS